MTRNPGRPWRRLGCAVRAAALLLLFMLVAAPAEAHRLRVFASAEGAEIVGYAYFGTKSRAKGITITATRADGSVAYDGRSDDNGQFRFTATQRQDHVITADAGDGHRASFTLPADVLPENLPSAQSAPAPAQATRLAPTEPPSAASPVAALPACAPAADAAAGLATLLDAAIARQIRPLREELDAAQSQERLRDVVAGIGFITGLAGLAYGLLMRQRVSTMRAPSAQGPGAAPMQGAGL